MNDSSPRAQRVLTVAVIAIAAASIVLAFWLTRTAWFRTSDGMWHLRVLKASALLLPASILLFALGVEWAMKRRALIAVAALLPLPAWIVTLHMTHVEPAMSPGAEGVLSNANLLVNDLWLGIIMMQMQGLQPFGGA